MPNTPTWLPPVEGLPNGAAFSNDKTGEIFMVEKGRYVPVTQDNFQKMTKTQEQGPSRTEQAVAGGLRMASELPFLLAAGPGGIGARIGTKLGLGAMKRGITKGALEAGLPAATEFGIQKAGLAPENTGDIVAAGLIPGAVRGALGAPRAMKDLSRGMAGLVIPQQMKGAGTEVFQGMTRGIGSGADEAFEAVRLAGPVDTKGLVEPLADAIKKESTRSTPNSGAIRFLGNMQSKFAKGGNTYDEVLAEVQRLRGEASSAFRAGRKGKAGGSARAKTLSDASNKILDALDAGGVQIRKANQLFRQKEAVRTLGLELSKTNPGPGIRRLFDFDELVKGAFTASERSQIVTLADTISRVAGNSTIGEGILGRSLKAIGEPLARLIEKPAGRDTLERLMTSPGDPNMKIRMMFIMAAQGTQGSVGRIGER